MAKAGFIYLGHDDWTMCAFCGLMIYAWQSHDIPFTEHNKKADQCSYLTLTHVPDSDGSHVVGKLYGDESSGDMSTNVMQPIIPFLQGSQPPKFTSFGKFPK